MSGISNVYMEDMVDEDGDITADSAQDASLGQKLEDGSDTSSGEGEPSSYEPGTTAASVCIEVNVSRVG